MKDFVRLNKNEMKMVMGGTEAVGEIGGEGGGGRCVECTCPDGSSSCWYSKRSASELCNAVCGTSTGVNSLDNLPSCSGCTMN